MKVLIIQPWISWRGAETVSVLECYYLNKLKIPSKLLCLFVDKGSIPPRGSEIDYILPHKKIRELFYKSKLFFYIFCFPYLFFMIMKNSENFDILNPHNLPSLWLAAITKKFKKVKVVWTCHSILPDAGMQKNVINLILWRLGFKYIDRWSVRNCDQIIAVSKKIKLELIHAYNVESKVIYPPFEANYYSGGNYKSLSKFIPQMNNKFIFLHVSGLTEDKEPKFSINLLKKLIPVINNSVLIFVGNDKGKSEIINLAKKLGIDKKIYFSGVVKPQDLKHYYAVANLIVNPYFKNEGCPMVPIQAFSAGKVSIVSKNSGIDEIIKSEGIGIVAKFDVSDYVGKIVGFWKNRKYWSEIVSRRKKSIEKYSGLNYSRNLISIFRTVSQN